jgi:hypothetical protein
MLVPGYPDGVDAQILLNDLRFTKLPKETRTRVMELLSAYRSRTLTASEDAWVRAECRKRKKKIAESHQLQDNARLTNAEIRLGSERFKRLRAMAAVKTRDRLLDKLHAAEQVLRSAEEEQKNFGI